MDVEVCLFELAVGWVGELIYTAGFLLCSGQRRRKKIAESIQQKEKRKRKLIDRITETSGGQGQLHSRCSELQESIGSTETCYRVGLGPTASFVMIKKAPFLKKQHQRTLCCCPYLRLRVVAFSIPVFSLFILLV